MQELALREEDERRNKQLQASIAETSERQADAITRRCTTAKVTAAAIVRKAHSKLRNSQNRNKGRHEGQDDRYSGEEEEFMEQYGSAIGRETEIREKRQRRRKQETTSSLFDGSDEEQGEAQGNKSLRFALEKKVEVKAETSTANAGKWEGLATWARAGARSHMRYGSLSTNNSRNVHYTRATVLFDALSAAVHLESDVKFDIHFTLVPADQSDNADKLPSLEKPSLCCPANVTVQHICKFIVSRLSVASTGEIELLVGNTNTQSDLRIDGKSIQRLKGKACEDGVKPCRSPEILHPQATLGQVYTYFWHSFGNLVIMYRRKI